MPGRANQPIEIDELLSLQLSDEPEHHMYEADRDLKANKKDSAAHNLRKAIVFLRIDAANATGDARNSLELAGDDLLAMTHRIEQGTEIRTVDLEYAFARAEHAMAENYCACAKESWGHKQARPTGYRMRAASAAIERSAKWSGKELDAAVQASVDDTRRLGAALVEENDYVVDEIGEGIAALGNGIFSVGRCIER